MPCTHGSRGRWLERLELVVPVSTRDRGTLALPLALAHSFRACRSGESRDSLKKDFHADSIHIYVSLLSACGYLPVPDPGLQQSASSTRWSVLHRGESKSDQLHGSRRVDSLVGLVGVLANLRIRDENAATHVHESSPGFRGASVRGTRPRRQYLHRPSTMSGQRRGTAIRIVRPVVHLGWLERLLQTL